MASCPGPAGWTRPGISRNTRGNVYVFLRKKEPFKNVTLKATIAMVEKEECWASRRLAFGLWKLRARRPLAFSMRSFFPAMNRVRPDEIPPSA